MTRELYTRDQKAAGLDASQERLICTGLVISDRVAKDLAPLYRPEHLIADFTRWVADRCIEFHREHGTAPGRHIRDIYDSSVRSGMDRDLAGLVDAFLTGISGEYERAKEFNAGYVVERATLYFRARALREATRETDAFLEAGQIEEAETRWGAYKSVGRPGPEGVNPFTDKGLIQRSFERQDAPLFTLPGAAGKLLSAQTHRKNFLSLRGAAGKGKTYALQELAKAAVRYRLNGVFIGIGDMSEEEYTMRWLEGLTGRSSLVEQCQPGWIPCLDCERNQDGSCKLRQRAGTVELPKELRDAAKPDPEYTPRDYVPCSYCEEQYDFHGAAWWEWQEEQKVLTWQEALEAGERFSSRLKGKDFKLLCYPSKATTPDGLDMLLERWRDYENWLPDVMFLDYMDELGSDDKFDQFRHQEAGKWSAMRGLATRWNLLLVSADQSDADGYTQETLSMKNFNEDRRRNDVLTGGLGINQTPAEKFRGVARWAYFKLRRGAYGLGNQVCIVQALSRGRAVVGSWWRRGKKSEKKTE